MINGDDLDVAVTIATIKDAIRGRKHFPQLSRLHLRNGAAQIGKVNQRLDGRISVAKMLAARSGDV